MSPKICALLIGLGLALPFSAMAEEVEVFAKGSISKNFISKDSYTVTISGSTGLAVTLIPQLRIEARYTNNSSLQNHLGLQTNSVTITLSDIKTETTIFSLGIDVDLVGERYAVQPFIFVGAGYLETTRSYYYQVTPTDPAVYHQEPKELGISGNLGAGIRIRVAKAVAIELECFAYGMGFDKPDPLVNLYGTAGVRLFL